MMNARNELSEHNSERFSPSELKEISEKLRQKRMVLSEEIDRRRSELEILNESARDELSLIHPADRGTIEFEQDMSYESIERCAAQVKEIDEAFLRLDSKQYGVCEDCGEDIPIARLKALPEARFCSQCQRELEKSEKQHRHIPQVRI